MDAAQKRLDAASVFPKQVFVFVHGFNVSFENALRRTAQIAYDLNFDGAPFLFSWPSGDGMLELFSYQSRKREDRCRSSSGVSGKDRSEYERDENSSHCS